MQYDLGKWVSNARKQANLTQEELADAVGFSGKGSVSAIENGRNKPTFEVMVKISEICNYPLPYQNQVINNNASHIQVGGNNFGNASFCISENNQIPINIENINQQNTDKPFLLRVSSNDLCDEGIFKDDVLTVNPNITARHGNFVLALSTNGRGLIAKLLIDLKNQYSLKYNGNTPEVMPEGIHIVGVITNLHRTYI